jgi:6-phosphofructokinase
MCTEYITDIIDLQNFKIAIMHSGAPSPGMNAAVRAIVRLGLHAGYTVLAVQNGFSGLAKGQVQEMQWLSVNGWALKGGSELGTNRSIPTSANIVDIAKVIDTHQIKALIMFGGYTGYQGSIELNKYKERFPLPLSSLIFNMFCAVTQVWIFRCYVSLGQSQTMCLQLTIVLGLIQR